LSDEQALAPAAESATEPAGMDARPAPDNSMVQCGLPDAAASFAKRSAEEAVSPDIQASHETSPEVEAADDDRRQQPLRFLWQMDAEGSFSLGSDEFTRLIGARAAAGFGRPWNEIAAVFGLDPEGRVVNAVATHEAWSGITLNWPTDGGGRLPVELTGLPIFDRMRNFAGYRGFGVCRDLDSLTRLTALRHVEAVSDSAAPPRPSAGEAAAAVAGCAADTRPSDPEMPVEPPSVEMPENVVPFRPPGDAKYAALTPVENNAFNELARQLAARLESENLVVAAAPATAEANGRVLEQPAPQKPQAVDQHPGWLVAPEQPARGEAGRDKALLDLLPVGVLIYRLDRLLYANPAFLDAIGYRGLHDLQEAGGLDALYVEAGVSTASSTSDTGTPVTISAGASSPDQPPSPGADARLYTIAWDGDPALALIFSAPGSDSAQAAAAIAPAPAAPTPTAAASPAGHADAEELGAILDTMADGIVMFDAEGNLNCCNRSAEALFGYDGAELVQRNLAQLFAPESQRAVRDYLDGLKGADIAGQLDHGRDVLGRVREGGLIPLSMTMGRTRPGGANFFAVFRDQSQSRKSEGELQQARRVADRAANAKADLLAQISHEVRTPLNAIIGFAGVMIGERFGALGERYVEYMKDIRASGERVIAIINDLLELSRIETGKLDLVFTNQNLNDIVESCVAVMQPQANRERIIIRTSLTHGLRPVLADAHALRQVTLNLIANSIHLANAGGQVIVSTALSDFGEVVLRVRDTGHGLNDNEVAAAMEPFRTQAPSDQAPDSGVRLCLTKALVEANRAQFHIRTAPHSGTLIEVVFAMAQA
jgi:PAS domain S-box-containing protein